MNNFEFGYIESRLHAQFSDIHAKPVQVEIDDGFSCGNLSDAPYLSFVPLAGVS